MKAFTSIRNLIRKVPRRALVAGGALLAVAAISTSMAVAEFYPNRPTFDYNDPAQRVGSMTGPIFNSFINTPSYGDERSFLDARRSDQTDAGSFKDQLSDVTGGSKEVVLRTYVHNNANQSTNATGVGIAHDAKVRIALPTDTSQTLRARSYISASNAATVEDTVDMVDSRAFSVQYVPGSATLYNNGPFQGGTALNDSIVADGAPIGYDQMNGDLPGCFDFEAMVQIKVRVTPVAAPEIAFNKQVRIKGDTTWHKEVATKPGDTVQWLLTTDNSGDADLHNIVVRDVLPPHVSLVPGTVKWIDASQNAAQTDQPLFDGGINVGNYAPGGGFYMIFDTTVKGDFEEREVRVRNLGYVKSTETPEKEDTADVIITRDVPIAENLYRCDVLDAVRVTGRTYRFTTKYTFQNVTFRHLSYDFGHPGATQLTDRSTVEHTFPADGTYTTKVTLAVDVNGTTQTNTGPACTAVVNVNGPQIPEQPTKGPTTLPNTGPGGIIAAVFALTTAVVAAAHHVVARRQR